MTAQLVLKSKDIINDYPKRSLIDSNDHKPSKPSKSSMTSTVTINSNNKNDKNVKNTKPKLLNNENDGKIFKKREEEMSTKSIKQNHAKNDPIKVQNEFMDAMTNTIIRFLDKNPESNKRLAEESVFIALGYDASIEYQHETEENDNEEEDEDEDDDIDYKTKHRQSFLNEIKHYRRHHIMRDRDAIRTFRIKQLHNIIMQQHPTYQSRDVLQHLTRKLNELYLPSPSPPPPIIEENKENIPIQQDMDNSKINNKDNKNKTNLSKNVRNTVKLLDIVQTKNCKKICKDKSINVTINQSNNNNQNDKKMTMSNSNDNENKNEVISSNAINNDKYKNNEDHSQLICDKSNNNDHNDNNNDRESSPSQIYITVNDTFGNDNDNNMSSASPLKYNEPNPSSINKQGIGFKRNSYISSTSSLSTTTSSSPSFMDHYQTNTFMNDKLSSKQSKYFVSTFNNEDDEALMQKMKLHKKSSRKRKSEMNHGFENGQISQIAQPPKKRARYGGNKTRQKKLRNKNNKSRGRGRGDRKSSRNPYGINGNQQNLRRNANDNRSTDCFDDEEDDGSDIDLNLNPNNTNNLLRPQPQHL